MPYTLWSKDRLLGESELDYIGNTDKHMMGDFIATDAGEQLMPIITGVRRAIIEMGRARRAVESSDRWKPDAIRSSEEYADVAEATAHLEGLELQLRDPAGQIVAADWIDVTDTEYTLSLANDFELNDLEGELREQMELQSIDFDQDADLLDEHFAAIEADGPPDFEPESVFPRYQIQVQLA